MGEQDGEVRHQRNQLTAEAVYRDERDPQVHRAPPVHASRGIGGRDGGPQRRHRTRRRRRHLPPAQHRA